MLCFVKSSQSIPWEWSLQNQNEIKELWSTCSVFCGRRVYTETFFGFPRTWCNNTTGRGFCWILSLLLSPLQPVLLPDPWQGGKRTSALWNHLLKTAGLFFLYSAIFVGEVGSNSSSYFHGLECFNWSQNYWISSSHIFIVHTFVLSQTWQCWVSSPQWSALRRILAEVWLLRCVAASFVSFCVSLFPTFFHRWGTGYRCSARSAPCHTISHGRRGRQVIRAHATGSRCISTFVFCGSFGGHPRICTHASGQGGRLAARTYRAQGEWQETGQEVRCLSDGWTDRSTGWWGRDALEGWGETL